MTELTPTDAVETPPLLAWLRDRDVPCPLCGYNLRGLTADRCPECGRELRLGVSLAEPFLKAWVAVLVALLLPAGFGAVLLFGVAYGVARAGTHDLWSTLSDIPLAYLLVLLYVAASVPLSAFAIAFRRRFLRRSRRQQGVAAVVAWAALAASVLYLVRGVFRL